MSTIILQKEGENISYEYAIDQAKQNKDIEASNDLESMKNSTNKDFIQATLEKEKVIDKYSPFKVDVNITREVVQGCLFSPESNGIDAIKYACGNILSAEKLWGTNKEFNLFDDVKKVDIPIYFFAGKYDYITPSILVEKYYEKLEAPHKEFIWFENSAHFPQCTENDKFCDLMLKITNKNL